MNPWGTPALTRYSCEDFSSRATSRLLLRKEEIRPNIWPEIPNDLGLWRRPAYQTLLKAFISNATTWVAPDLLKALAVLSDTTLRRSAVDQEDLKPYWKSEKGHIISVGVNSRITYKFFKDFISHRKE